jgi:hypothetical protein
MLGAGSSTRYLQGVRLDSNSLTARSGWGAGSVGEEVQGSHEVQAWVFAVEQYGLESLLQSAKATIFNNKIL